jgi:hypothetical protein
VGVLVLRGQRNPPNVEVTVWPLHLEEGASSKVYPPLRGELQEAVPGQEGHRWEEYVWEYHLEHKRIEHNKR